MTTLATLVDDDLPSDAAEDSHDLLPLIRSVELFDLKTELSQKQNIAADYPDKVAERQSLLKQIRETGHSAPRLVERD